MIIFYYAYLIYGVDDELFIWISVFGRFCHGGLNQFINELVSRDLTEGARSVSNESYLFLAITTSQFSMEFDMQFGTIYSQKVEEATMGVTTAGSGWLARWA